jgi:hypothetical protein
MLARYIKSLQIQLFLPMRKDLIYSRYPHRARNVDFVLRNTQYGSKFNRTSPHYILYFELQLSECYWGRKYFLDCTTKEKNFLIN